MKHPKGFTLVELVIVVTMILIIASAAITQGISTQRTLHYKNSFNKAVAYVQQARNYAVNDKTNSNAIYTVKFSQTAAGHAMRVFDNTNANLEPLYTFPAYSTVEIIGNSTCNANSMIEFSPALRGADTTLRCDDNTVNKLTVNIRYPDQNKLKSFVIHKAAGVPQVVE